MKTTPELVGYIMVIASPKVNGEAKVQRIISDTLEEKHKIIILN